jgi:hypothetical protein
MKIVGHASRLFLLLMALFIPSSAAYPCSCGEIPLSEKLKISQAIFVGEVVEVKYVGNAQNAIKFKVERYWKGVNDSFIIITSDLPVSCLFGLSAEVGDKYLIYAYEYKGQLDTDACVSRRFKDSKKELKKLGKGQAVIPARAT